MGKTEEKKKERFGLERGSVDECFAEDVLGCTHLEVQRKKRLVLAALVYISGITDKNENGEFFVENDFLSDVCAISTPTLISSLKSLEDSGIIQRTPGKRGKASTYKVEDCVIGKRKAAEEEKRVLEERISALEREVAELKELVASMAAPRQQEKLEVKTLSPAEQRKTPVSKERMDAMEWLVSYTRKDIFRLSNFRTASDGEEDMFDASAYPQLLPLLGSLTFEREDNWRKVHRTATDWFNFKTSAKTLVGEEAAERLIAKLKPAYKNFLRGVMRNAPFERVSEVKELIAENMRGANIYKELKI